MISKNFLYVLVAKRAYYVHQAQRHFVFNGQLKEYFNKNVVYKQSKLNDVSQASISKMNLKHEISRILGDDEEFNDGYQQNMYEMQRIKGKNQRTASQR